MARYYEDLRPGEVFTSRARTVTEHDVMAFAGLSGDYNQVHTDRTFAAETRFGEPIAHGLLAISIATGLINRTGVFDGTTVALLGIDSWRFNEVIRIGDTIHVEFEIGDMRETSNEAVGIVRRLIRIVNQDGVTVQEGEMTSMIRRRPAEANAGRAPSP